MNNERRALKNGTSTTGKDPLSTARQRATRGPERWFQLLPSYNAGMDHPGISMDTEAAEAVPYFNWDTPVTNAELREVLRKRQVATLMLNLLLSTYQRQLGLQLGVLPGTEFLEAAQAAEAHGIPVALCDRDVRITLRRAWHSLRWWKKLWLLSGLLASVFEKQELSEDDLRELRQQDVLSRAMEELGTAFPSSSIARDNTSC